MMNDIPGNTICENKLEGSEDPFGVRPGQRVYSFKFLLMLLCNLAIRLLSFVLGGAGFTFERFDFWAGEG
jgi:hypothetical protein